MQHKINTTLISGFVLQLNYQKYIPLPASASPERTQHLPNRPASVRGIITPVLFTQFASFPPKSYLQKDISSRSGLHELPCPGQVWSDGRDNTAHQRAWAGGARESLPGCQNWKGGCPRIPSFTEQIFMEWPLSFRWWEAAGCASIAGVSRATWSEFKP